MSKVNTSEKIYTDGMAYIHDESLFSYQLKLMLFFKSFSIQFSRKDDVQSLKKILNECL